ncbi:MAG: DNA repair protein RadA [Candidatus Daviesbacteria bacterium]|nr:DNA repair protein RadA [Candidatus Daviesbacteria bacterium]
MPKFSSVYICQQCGYRSSQYLGKCPQCDSWNSLVEEVEESHQQSAISRQIREKAEIVDLSKIQKTDYQRLSTKLEEFDRCLGGGVVPGSLVLISGDPGIGKSTLLTQLALNIKNTLYVAGEESAQQIKIRVDRMKPNASLTVLNEIDVDLICDLIKKTKPALAVIDSIQTLETADLESIAGSIGQVRESAQRLHEVAKSLHIPIFLVGHVTKEGSIAGPKTLEHMVDVVLSLEGDSNTQFRILRANKNRFGPTDEVGVFEMNDTGMMEVKNPSKLFLEQKVNAPGSAVVAILAGVRPLLVEIQALVTKSNLPSPRRMGSGVDNNRLQLLVAVLQKRLGLPLWDQDVFVNVTGGLKIFEPAADLGICLAIISSFKDKTIKERCVLIGEVGLLGELRTVRALDKRITEAKKLGFSNVISSEKGRSIASILKQAFVE